MYSCPSDDIHSIYLDNELPLAYIKEYEDHIQSCAACAEKLNHLKKMRSIFKTDSQSLDKNQEFLDESFKRLQTKLRYSKNTGKIRFNEKPEFKLNENYIKAGIGAAAAVLIAVILPVRFSKAGPAAENSGPVAEINPIVRPNSNASPISTSNIVINGNINDNLAHNVSNGTIENPQFADVDVFRPEFTDKGEVPYRMHFPEFDRPPVPRRQFRSMDFQSPADVNIISGQNSEDN